MNAPIKRKGPRPGANPRSDQLFADILGKQFGNLTVVRGYKIVNSRMVVEAVCSCGNEREVRANSLKTGIVKSCGCLQPQVVAKRNFKHGLCKGDKHPLFGVWSSMKARCYNPNAARFDRYGGRGIKVCDRWLNSFATFVEDMGPRPEGCSIDRIDNNGHYEPGNCRWATKVTQSRNTSVKRFIEFRGRRLRLVDWSRLLNVPISTLHLRLRKMPPHEALAIRGAS